MKKMTVIFCLMGIMLMCNACATSKEFKSLKEADCYFEQVRVDPKYAERTVASTPFKRFSKQKSVDKVGVGLSAASLLAGNFVTELVLGPTLFTGPNRGYTMKLSGMIDLGRPAIAYRKEPGKPVLDIASEALKLAGEPAKSPSCIYEGVRIHSDGLFSSEYKGEDGHIKIAKYFSVYIYFRDNQSSETPCDKKTWDVYTDFGKKITGHVGDLMKRELAKPAVSCPSGK